MQRNERIKTSIAIIINVIVFGITVYYLITLIKSLINGNNRFIYFTTISNLLVGLMTFINVVFLILSLVKNKDYIPFAFSLIKLILISMTTLTFFVVLFIIAPINGYQESYSGRNLLAHLIIPLLSLTSYLFFEEKSELEWRYSSITLIPLFIYSIVYVINAIVLKSWPDIYSINKQGLWYLFLIAFLAMDFVLGQGLYFLKRFIDEKSRYQG